MKTRTLLAMLLASSALSGVAFAQTAPMTPSPISPSPISPSSAAPTGLGDSQPSDIGKVRAGAVHADGTTRTDAGGGLMIEEDAPKSRSTVTRDFIDKQSPTSNPYQLLRMLPGANQSSPDALGLNGGNITIRGLNSDQIGLTIEGAPVNDSGNYALFPQEYVDAENLQQIALTHGSSDLDSPHIGAVGGVVNIYMRDPLREMGGLVDFSVGNNQTYRTFLRADTGDIPGTKLRAFLSYSHYENKHWRGPGGDNRDNFEGKLVGEFGNGNRVSFAFLYNDAVNNFYRNPTLAQYQTNGQYGTNYNATPASATDTQFYKIQVNPFKNLIVSAPSSFNIAENLTYDVTPYFWYGYGNGGGATAVNTASFFFGTQQITIPGVSGTKLYYSPSITETFRPGIINKLTYTWNNHKLVAGYWFERADHHQFGPYSAITADGSPANVFGDTGLVVASNGAIPQKRDQTTITTTNVFFIGDTISMMNDHLFLDFGLKQAFISRDGTNRMPGSIAKVSLSDTETLPTAAIRYKINDQNTVFASVATNFRTPQNFTLFDSYSSSTGAKTNFANANQQPETSVTWEIGHRFQNSMIDTAVTAFYTSFQNRLVSTTTPDPAGGSGLISTNINVGGQRNYGIDMEAGLKPFHHFRPYVSAEFMNSELTDNYRVGADFLPTRGKQAVRTPQMQAAIGIDYDDDHFFANLNGKYVGSQYATFMNDEKIPGYFTADATIGYHLPEFGGLKAPKIQVNVFNILNNKFLSGVAGPQTNAKATRGVNGTTIAAASASSYYVGAPAAFLVTLSSAF